ncbi:hypothetical protein BHM03_00003466, partial [Ensete ventricosum]
SSFSPKDALTPLSPYASSPSLPLRRRRLHLPIGSRRGHPCGLRCRPCWRQAWPRVAAPYGCPAACPLYRRCVVSGCDRGWLSPLRAGRSWPCMRATRFCPQVPPLLLTAFAVKMLQERVE